MIKNKSMFMWIAVCMYVFAKKTPEPQDMNMSGARAAVSVMRGEGK